MPRALILLLSFLPASALAAGQGENAVTGGAGLALALTGPTRVGAAVDVRLLHGFNDSWSARLGLEGSWLPGSGDTSATRIVTPSLGLTVAADVLNLVPFAEAGFGFADIRGGGTASRQYLGGQLGVGVDYLATRHLTLSLLGRLDYFALRLAGPDGSRPVVATFALHLGRVF